MKNIIPITYRTRGHLGIALKNKVIWLARLLSINDGSLPDLYVLCECMGIAIIYMFSCCEKQAVLGQDSEMSKMCTDAIVSCCIHAHGQAVVSQLQLASESLQWFSLE